MHVRVFLEIRSNIGRHCNLGFSSCAVKELFDDARGMHGCLLEEPAKDNIQFWAAKAIFLCKSADKGFSSLV